MYHRSIQVIWKLEQNITSFKTTISIFAEFIPNLDTESRVNLTIFLHVKYEQISNTLMFAVTMETLYDELTHLKSYYNII